jgi:protein gp37
MTTIQWTEKTWNPVVGCSVISPGCTNCYAMRDARRLAAISTTRDKYADLTIETKAGPVWNGKLRFWEANLLEPLGWKRSAMVFVNSMSDLAHHAMPVEWFERVWRVMVEARQANGHIFQVLTKRPENLLKLLAAIGVTTLEPGIWLGGESGRKNPRPFHLEWARLMRDACRNAGVAYFLKQIGRTALDAEKPFLTRHHKGGNPTEWPDDLRVREWPESPAPKNGSPSPARVHPFERAL